MQRRLVRLHRGVTMLEMLVVVAIIGILLALAVPSFNGMIARERVRGVNAELVTDLQFARAEAVKRGVQNAGGVRIAFRRNSPLTMTCYSLYISPSIGFCDCLRPQASRCTTPGAPSADEIKTVQVLKADGVEVNGPNIEVWFSGDRGVVSPALSVSVSASSGVGLITKINGVGRVQVCSPDGSMSGVPVCE